MAENTEAECCPRFDPKKWDGKVLAWKDKRFVKDRVITLFYIPMNFGAVMKRLDRKVRNAGATMQDGLTLSDHASKWSMDLLVAVDKEVPGAQNTTLSGRFLCKVFEGDFKETGKWCEEFDAYAAGKRLRIEKEYMWYTTCPKCAKKYGKNYVVILGKVG